MILSRLAATFVVLAVGMTMSYVYMPSSPMGAPQDSADARQLPLPASDRPGLTGLIAATTTTRSSDLSWPALLTRSDDDETIATTAGLALAPAAAATASILVGAQHAMARQTSAPVPVLFAPGAEPMRPRAPERDAGTDLASTPVEHADDQPSVERPAGPQRARRVKREAATPAKPAKRAESMFLHPLGQR